MTALVVPASTRIRARSITNVGTSTCRGCRESINGKKAQGNRLHKALREMFVDVGAA